jgi:hypothetical protein
VKIQLTQAQIEAIILGETLVFDVSSGEAFRKTIELAINPKDLYFQADKNLGPPGIDAQHDNELAGWLLGVAHGDPVPSGSFLHFLAHAALTADPENYHVMRPLLMFMKNKYPKYGSPAGGGVR